MKLFIINLILFFFNKLKNKFKKMNYNETSFSNLNIFKYKIVFIGDLSVGKSAIINRFIYDSYIGIYKVIIILRK